MTFIGEHDPYFLEMYRKSEYELIRRQGFRKLVSDSHDLNHTSRLLAGGQKTTGTAMISKIITREKSTDSHALPLH